MLPKNNSWVSCLTWIALSLPASGMNEITVAVTYKFAQPIGPHLQNCLRLSKSSWGASYEVSAKLSCTSQLVSTDICCLKARTGIWMLQENLLPWHSPRVSLQPAKPLATSEVARTSECLSVPTHQTEPHLFQHRTGEMSIKLGNIPSYGWV